MVRVIFMLFLLLSAEFGDGVAFQMFESELLDRVEGDFIVNVVDIVKADCCAVVIYP